jgi:hypothetical protein
MSRAAVLAMCVLGIGAMTADSLAIPARSNASVTVARVILVFRKLGQVYFAQRESFKIKIADASTREVWSARYSVIFSLA